VFFFPATLTEKNAAYKSNMYCPQLDKLLLADSQHVCNVNLTQQ